MSGSYGGRGFDGGKLSKNRRTRAPSLARVLQLFLVCSTLLQVRYPGSVAL